MPIKSKFRKVKTLSPSLRSKIDAARTSPPWERRFSGFTPEEQDELARYLATTKTDAALSRDMMVHRQQCRIMHEALDPDVSRTDSGKWSSHLSSVRARYRDNEEAMREVLLFEQENDRAHGEARMLRSFGE